MKETKNLENYYISKSSFILVSLAIAEVYLKEQITLLFGPIRKVQLIQKQGILTGPNWSKSHIE